MIQPKPGAMGKGTAGKENKPNVDKSHNVEFLNFDQMGRLSDLRISNHDLTKIQKVLRNVNIYATGRRQNKRRIMQHKEAETLAT